MRFEIIRLSLCVVLDQRQGLVELRQAHESLHQRDSRYVITGIEPQGLAVLVGGWTEALLTGIDGSEVEMRE